MIGTIAWAAVAAAAFLLFRSQQHINQLESSLRTFDQHAREASQALAEARVAQQGYVAVGQGTEFWMTKVSSMTEAASAALASLRQTATASGRASVDEAIATTAEFSNLDRRVRDYLQSDEQLMAGDVIFTEGSDAAAAAGRQVEAARLAEHQGFDRDIAAIRRQQAMVLGGAAGVVALMILALVPLRRVEAAESAAEPVESSGLVAAPMSPALALHSKVTPSTEPAMFRAAADIATDFGRVRDVEELSRIIGRAADLLDASGLMVWMADATGMELRPVLAHGYSNQMLARIPPVPRAADNAAAKAYRAGTLQIVLSRPGGVQGAVVAPIMSADGCIGALSAEIRGGAETSDSIQGLAAIFAAHLASVLAATAPTTADMAAARAVNG